MTCAGRRGAELGAAWLAALFGPSPALALTGRPAEGLFGAWQRWSGQAHVAGDLRFRSTFREEAPAEGQGR